MRTKYSKDIAWIKPLVESVADLVPVETVPRFQSYKTPLDRITRAYGAIIKYQNGKISRITILTKSQKEKILSNGKATRTGYKHAPMYTVLDTLAHELAHLVHWEHTPEHLRLTARIMIRFTRVLEKMGYEDIEKEARQIRKEKNK